MFKNFKLFSAFYLWNRICTPVSQLLQIDSKSEKRHLLINQIMAPFAKTTSFSNFFWLILLFSSLDNLASFMPITLLVLGLWQFLLIGDLTRFSPPTIVYAFNYFGKRLHLRCLMGFWMCLCAPWKFLGCFKKIEF